MKKLNTIIIVIIFAITAIACQSIEEIKLDEFSTQIYTPKYADGFSIKALPDSTATLIQISKPWQGAKDQTQNLIISNKEIATPQNLKGAIIKSPIKRVIALSSSNIAMFDAIDKNNYIVGVSGIDYISNQEVLKSYNDGKTLDIGYDSDLNYEAIIALRPDIVLLYGVAGEDRSVTSKLKELNIQHIYIGDYAEQSPLAKAEWIVAMGEICGVRAEAISRFNEIEQRYITLRDSVSINIARDTMATQRPKVMLNAPYREVWYMPSADNYMAQLIADAGGEYIYNENKSGSSQPISLEKAYQLLSQCNIWINMGAGVRSVQRLKSQNPIFAEMEVVTKENLYNNTARSTPMGGSDFWESGVVNPDIVLRDLIKIINPKQATDHELYYYEKLQ